MLESISEDIEEIVHGDVTNCSRKKTSAYIFHECFIVNKRIKRSNRLVTQVHTRLSNTTGQLRRAEWSTTGSFVQGQGKCNMSNAILLLCVAISISYSYHVIGTLLNFIKMPHGRRHPLYLGCQRVRKNCFQTRQKVTKSFYIWLFHLYAT